MGNPAPCFKVIPFGGVGVAAVDDGVEIDGHVLSFLAQFMESCPSDSTKQAW
ncbi:MAG: Uncharacterised protein [SAR116 cluster bacterium]|nr:MAG: Uncharacterised protein [SAR116 cluster bacterium]